MKKKNKKKIAIISTITLMLTTLCFSIIPNTYKETKAEEQGELWQLNASYNDMPTTTFTNDSKNYTITQQKISGGNDAINIIGNVYTQKSKNTNGNGIWVKYSKQIHEDVMTETTLTHLLIMKLTPYNINRQTIMQIHNQLNVYLQQIYADYDYENMWLNSQILTTTENLDFLIDNTTWNNNDLITTYESIKSPSYGFRYNLENYYSMIQHEIPVESSLVYGTTFTYELEITPYTNNYIIVATQPYFHRPNAVSNIGTSRVLGNNSQFNTTQNSTRLAGYNYIPNGTTEVIDIPDIMFTVLTMPFSFISVAFNLTLFPGTPYQVNISALFLAIIAVLIFIFIMKIIISTASKMM